MKARKITASILCIVLCICLLASCNKNGGSQPVYENGVYVPKDDIKITVWQTQGTDYTAKALKGSIVEEWLVNKTKVKVDNIYGNDGGQWDAKLSKLIAGDCLPEIVACGGYQGPAHFSKLNDLKQVWELTPEILQKYAPNVWKRTPKEFWDKIKVDGKIYGIPYLSEPTEVTQPDATEEELTFIRQRYVKPVNKIFHDATYGLYIRDDISKKLFPESKTYDELVALLEERQEPIGEELLDIPIKSTEDYIKLMYDIKDAGIKEKGKTVYAFGYDGGDNWGSLVWLGSQMMGYLGHAYTGTWNNATKKIEIPLVREEVKEAARIQNKMLSDKVIDPESMAHTSAQYKEKVLNGQYAIAPLNPLGGLTMVNDQLADLGKPYRYRPLYTQVPAIENYPVYEEMKTWSGSLCITKTASEAEFYQILNWIDTQFSDEFESVCYWGPEDAGLYTEDENGKRTFKDERFTKYYIEGDKTVLTAEETLGLGGPNNEGYSICGLFSVMSSTYSRWRPEVHKQYVKYKPTVTSGFSFKVDSEYVTGVDTYPPCQGWSSEYADIPEVVTFWAERGQWENSIKIAVASPVEKFDSAWDSAIKELNNIVDIKAMEEKMTKIARKLAK